MQNESKGTLLVVIRPTHLQNEKTKTFVRPPPPPKKKEEKKKKKKVIIITQIHSSRDFQQSNEDFGVWYFSIRDSCYFSWWEMISGQTGKCGILNISVSRIYECLTLVYPISSILYFYILYIYRNASHWYFQILCTQQHFQECFGEWGSQSFSLHR